MKRFLIASLLVFAAANAEPFNMNNLTKADPAILADIAKDITSHPYSDSRGSQIYQFDNDYFPFPGSLGELAQGKITTHLESYGGMDPDGNQYHCTYPHGGVYVVYEIANPMHYQTIGEEVGTVFTCISSGWRVDEDGRSRRFDTAQAWGIHWKALNQGAVSGVKSAWNAVARFVRNQPIIDALLVAVLAFIGYRVYRRKAGKK